MVRPAQKSDTYAQYMENMKIKQIYNIWITYKACFSKFSHINWEKIMGMSYVKFRHIFGAHDHLIGRDLYRATPAVTQDLGFCSLIQRFSRLVQQTRGTAWRPSILKYSFNSTRSNEAATYTMFSVITVLNTVMIMPFMTLDYKWWINEVKCVCHSVYYLLKWSYRS